MVVGRIVNAGGVVYGAEDKYDSSAPNAAVMTALYAEQAHNYIVVARARGAASRERAIKQGRHTARRRLATCAKTVADP